MLPKIWSCSIQGTNIVIGFGGVGGELPKGFPPSTTCTQTSATTIKWWTQRQEDFFSAPHWNGLLTAWKHNLKCFGVRAWDRVRNTSPLIINRILKEELQLTKTEDSIRKIPHQRGSASHKEIWNTNLNTATQNPKMQSQASHIVFWMEGGPSQGACWLDWSNRRGKEWKNSLQLVWHQSTTCHIRNGECNHIRELHSQPLQAFVRAPHWKQTIQEELTHILAIWKAWCRMNDSRQWKQDNWSLCYPFPRIAEL